jgi:hypothetical protein
MPDDNGRMDDLDGVLGRLDEATAERVRSALPAIRTGDRGNESRPWMSVTAPALQNYLEGALLGSSVSDAERHEIAWALGDFFEAAGIAALAALCRDRSTHEHLAKPSPAVVRRERVTAWAQTLQRGKHEFWNDVLARLEAEPGRPARLELALTPVRALLDAVRDGVQLTNAGYLPPRTALALDAKFGWSDEYGVTPPRGETDLPALMFLHEHLREQGFLLVEGRTLTAAPSVPDNAVELWRALVDPGPRWQVGFEHDALAVMAATLVRTDELTRDQLRDEMAYLLASKWQGTGSRTVGDGVRGVELAWFRVGIALGWWDREGGLWSSKVKLSAFGRAAAASVFWAVATRDRAR